MPGVTASGTTTTPASGVTTSGGAGQNGSSYLSSSTDTSVPVIGPTTTSNRWGADSGYWVAIGCGISIAVADTPAAPLALGILVVAIIYQLNLLL